MIKDKFYKCACGCKVILISQINDYTEPTELELAFYSYGSEDEKTSLRDKLRTCWKVLTTGVGWEDQIILERKDIKNLIKTLDRAVKMK